MDGHECSEIMFSGLDHTSRLDAEYYSKEYVYETKQLMKRKHFTIEALYKVTDGEHGSVKYRDKGVKYLTAENIKTGFVDLSKIRYVSEDVDKRNARASVREGDILISIKGTLGSIAVAEKELPPCNMNRDVAVIKPILKNELSNYYLALFLMGKYGALQSRRGGSGGVQQMITLGRLREFIVPEFSSTFYQKLKHTYDLFLRLMRKSRTGFAQAEEYLLNQLECDMSLFCDDGTVVKSYAESFYSTGRLDAEYYQRRYEKLIEKLEAAHTIGTACSLYDRTYIPDRNSEYLYIELADIGRAGEIEAVDRIPGAELPTRARRIVKEGQIIVSSIEGSLESCALITPAYHNALCSTGFYVIDSFIYNSETLLVLLKSKPIQLLLKRGCSGTILTNISKEEFLNIPLPDISSETQSNIKSKVRDIYLLREKSKTLLDYAKRAVETAIEQNEAFAITQLTRRVSELMKNVEL